MKHTEREKERVKKMNEYINIVKFKVKFNEVKKQMHRKKILLRN